MKVPFKSMIIHHNLAKNKDASNGYFIEKNEALYFVSRKNIIRIKEHFAKTDKTALELFENTIRYEGKNSNCKNNAAQD